MKKLLIAIGICLLASMAFADEQFIVVTNDNEVTSIDAVKIKRVLTTQIQETKEEILTLQEIDSRIAKVQARIDHLQHDIENLQALRARISAHAANVILKQVEMPQNPETIK